MQENIERVSAQLQETQRALVSAFEALEPTARFKWEPWARAEGGGGITVVLEGGAHLEKAGVNFSHIKGGKLPASASAHRKELAGRSFEALGVSVVVHPRNPYAPTSHLNTRLFVAEAPGSEPVWWFGGGFDLTPYYGYVEDCILWHEAAQMACQPFNFLEYASLKAACDEYFYLKHRQEPRGIGGIFYDDLNAGGFEACFDFHRHVSSLYQKAYLEILNRRIALPFGEPERHHQMLRRGRYVEFNLLYDRGTLFGLQSNGRVESILMSLPPGVSWEYGAVPKTQKEAELLDFYLKPRDWLSASVGSLANNNKKG